MVTVTCYDRKLSTWPGDESFTTWDSAEQYAQKVVIVNRNAIFAFIRDGGMTGVVAAPGYFRTALALLMAVDLARDAH